MLKFVFTLFVCMCGSYLGQVIFKESPAMNWMIGALTGMAALAIQYEWPN